MKRPRHHYCFSIMSMLRLTIACTRQDVIHGCFCSPPHPGTPPRRWTMKTAAGSRSSVIRRFSSAMYNISTLEETDDSFITLGMTEDHLIHPDQLGEIPYPTSLSPSAVMEFKKCPQSYLFQYLYKMKQPTSLALAKGSMCHEALEKIFDLEPQERTLEHLHNFLRVSWSSHRLSDTYRFLFETSDGVRDVGAEQEWGRSALQLLDNYYKVEDPRTVTRPNPLKREIWLTAHLTVDPTLGATGYVTGGAAPGNDAQLSPPADSPTPPTFLVRGIVDRLDMVRTASRQVALRIVDYKTGKAPQFKYSRPFNEKIREEAFYQLKVYALLLKEKGADLEQTKAMDLRLLRLLFLTSEEGRAKFLDYDLGETELARDKAFQEVHQDLSNVWTSIIDLVSTQDPKAFVGCDRSFCYCHQCRTRFFPHTVWEPSN